MMRYRRPGGPVLVVAGLVLAGSLAMWYGFEKVSVPAVREYREGLWVWSGLLLWAAALTLVLARRFRRRADAHQT